MAHTTSRLGLDVVDGGDAVSNYPVANAQAMGVLDNAAIYGEGTLVSRGAASASAHGTVYRTTDAGAETLAWSDGSLWLPLGLVPATTAASANVASGQALIVTGSSAVTATLPSHAAGQVCAVVNHSTGGTTVSGSSIQGLGLSSASSFPLAVVGSGVVLVDDGTSWRFLSGQQDSGWVQLSLGGSGGSNTTEKAWARVRGDQVEMKGSFNSGGAANVILPSNMRPPANIGQIAISNSGGFDSATVTASTGAVAAASAGSPNLNNIAFSIS